MFVLVLVIGLVWGTTLVAAEESPQLTTPLPQIHGNYRSLLNYEEDPRYDHDLDWGQYLRFDAAPLLGDKNSFHFFGRIRAELDDHSSKDNALDDSDHRVFLAYGEFRDWLPAVRLRLGRQWIHEVEGVHLDGFRADWLDAGGFDFMGFAGQPVSSYSSTRGDKVFGGEVRFEPWDRTLLRLTGVRSDEDYPVVNDQIGLHWDQYWGTGCRTFAEYTFLNARGKEFRGGGSVFLQFLRTEISGNYYRRVSRTPVLHRDDVEGRRFSEFYLLLGETEELERYGLDMTHFLGEHFSILTGWSLVSILEEENPSNRNTNRFYATLSGYDFPIREMNFSLTGNYVHAEYDSDLIYSVEHAEGTDTVETTVAGDEKTFLLTGQMEYQLTSALEVAVGCSYGDFDFSRDLHLNQAYSEDLLEFGREYLVSGQGGRFITRTYFVELDWEIYTQINASLLAELDRSKVSANTDTEDYGRVLATVSWRF